MSVEETGALGLVLVVEDDAVWEREALAAVNALGAREVHVARSIAEATALTARHAYALAVVDIGLPDGSGLGVIRRLAAFGTPPVCVARTVFDDDLHLFGALAAGAHGYLLKGDPAEALLGRLTAALRGEPAVSPAIARRVLAFFRDGAPAEGPTATAESPASTALCPSAAHGAAPRGTLTLRETEVLRHVARGLTVGETARALGVSTNTVKTHVKSAYTKLDVSSRVEAMHAARRLGVLDA